MASIRVKHAISKSSERLTLKEAVQLGFLRSSDLAAGVDELPPFDAVRHVEDYLATINLKSFNSEGVERQWKDPANTVMYRMDTPSPPSSEAEPILSVEVDNSGTPEKEPKLKEPMTPTPNASRLQLAKVQRWMARRWIYAYSWACGKNCGPDQVVDPLTVAQKETKTVTIPLNLLSDLLLDLLSTHRVDLVDLIEVEPYYTGDRGGPESVDTNAAWIFRCPVRPVHSDWTITGWTTWG
ncbi:hypothetical protein CYMTET_42344 [Cymbomonas tetramitiformis]|uniref:Uncharacterized protein n=1 Tax=Cymbomonas tetramitiformis TaxID=36881 RepID=A0AAE0C6A1_9CHLO|nr:hypothetical protein CYMTET_42344 [Cymbomonas tetramitiformis]